MSETVMTIKELRKAFRNDPTMSKMIMPSTKAEIFLDLNGDGKADYAFIDSEGNGKYDTTAIDMTGNGEFNIYFKDTDLNGIADDVRFYMDGSDIPAFVNTDKGMEATFEAGTKEMLKLLSASNFDGAAVVKALSDAKAALEAAAKSAAGGDTRPVMIISELRKAIKADAVTSKMVMPSTKNEVFLDVNGDGKADFALISSTAGGNVDTFAMDMTGNGEFNLYFKDTDFNGIGDDVRYYKDGEDEATFVRQDKQVEAVINESAMMLINELDKVLYGKFDGASFVKVLEAIKSPIQVKVEKSSQK